MKAPEHLWILTLEPISLSEVLASVCFVTCDIRMILLPCGAVWVFLAILALFIGPSAAIHTGEEQSKRGKESPKADIPQPLFPGFSPRSHNKYTQDQRLCRSSQFNCLVFFF